MPSSTDRSPKEPAKPADTAIEMALELVAEYREEMENKDWLGTGSDSEAADKERTATLASIDERVGAIKALIKEP